MKISPYNIIGMGVAFSIISGCAIGFRTNDDDQTVVNDQQTTCIEHYQIDGPTSFYWDLEYSEEAYHSIMAEEQIDPNAFEPILPLGEFAVAGEPLLWMNKERTRAVVDGRFFGDLRVVDVTSFWQPPDDLTIGRVTPEGLTALGPREVLHFLLIAEIIKTYAHLDADVCLKSEQETTERYTAYYSGVHRYCTMECLEDSYLFSVEIDKTSGLITAATEEESDTR